MSLSRLSEKCRKCSKVDFCDHKKMEALAEIELPKIENMQVGGIVDKGALFNGSVSLLGNINAIQNIPLAKSAINASIISSIAKSIEENVSKDISLSRYMKHGV